MSIDTTGRPRQDDETPASMGGSGDSSAERTTGTQAGPNDDRGHRRAETLTREQYADVMRADGPLIREDPPDSIRSPHDSESDDRADIEEVDRERGGDYTAMLEGEPDRAEPTRAETLTREEYADAMRNGLADGHHERSASPDTESSRDASAMSTTVTHYHGEFKDEQLDLYTDGTRWAVGDTPRPQDTVVRLRKSCDHHRIVPGRRGPGRTQPHDFRILTHRQREGRNT